jgi:hypothetical protein
MRAPKLRRTLPRTRDLCGLESRIAWIKSPRLYRSQFTTHDQKQSVSRSIQGNMI